MEIVRRLPADLRGRFWLQHPVAEIYRPIWLQPSWYRDAALLIGYTERLAQVCLDNRIVEMAQLFEVISDRLEILKYMATRQHVMVELPPQMERRRCMRARPYKCIYDSYIGRLTEDFGGV